MQISDFVKYVGVDDRKIDLFEGQFDVSEGISYNSYIILDEKIAVLDSVDEGFGDEWISKIKNELGEKKPDFLVVHHMEMDHSSNIARFMSEFPESKIVASKMAFSMMKSMFADDFASRQVVANDGFELNLGARTLRFVAAPNVHWPEVIVSFLDGILFSADAFGKFGALDFDDPEGWACEARRYYFGIVGKFGANVQNLLKKIAPLGVKTICPLHGPVLSGNDALESIRLYDIWSSYGVESEGVAIFYTSVYGHTKKAAEKLAEILKNKGCPKVAINDLAREDTYECVEDAFRYGKLVLATTTYNGGVFPTMREFVEHLAERGYQNRTVAFIENGSWAPLAAKSLAAQFSSMKNIRILEEKSSIKISMNAENELQLEKIADALLK